MFLQHMFFVCTKRKIFRKQCFYNISLVPVPKSSGLSHGIILLLVPSHPVVVVYLLCGAVPFPANPL